MHKRDKTLNSGKIDTELATAMTTSAYFWILFFEHQLVTTNTPFQQKDRFKATRRHSRSKHWHLLGYALTDQHDMRDILHTRVMPHADCCTFTFKPPPKRKGPQIKKLQVHGLCDLRVKYNLQVMFEETS